MSTYQHPFAARPSLYKRHTSPSSAILLSLPTLEALPPTPRSAKSYEPLNAFVVKSNSTNICGSSENLHTTAKRKPQNSLSSTMPLIKSRSKRPTSSKPENYSFLPSIAAALDLRSIVSSRNNSAGIHQGPTSHSSPPGSASAIAKDSGYQACSLLSRSTPPSTFSKDSLTALPSIQGVFEAYENEGSEIRRNISKRGKGKRDTLKLPMMNPSERHHSRNIYPFDEQEKDDNWHWNEINQSAKVIIDREFIPPRQSNSQQTFALSSDNRHVPRKRNPSLMTETNTYLPRPTVSRKSSSSNQSRRPPHSSLPAHSRSSLQLSLEESQTAEDRSTLNQWLGPEDDNLDDVELQALNVLETLSGHLLRDGFGYGTGQPKAVENIPSLTQSGHSTPSKTRSRSTTYSTQATSDNNNRRFSQISESNPPSIREWTEYRKRTKSQIQQNRPLSEQNQTGRSAPIARRPPPPPPPGPPPPQSGLPPLPTQRKSMQSHTREDDKRSIFAENNVETPDNSIGINLNSENNKRSVRAEVESLLDHHQIQIPNKLLPLPIPPRAASRLDKPNYIHLSKHSHRMASSSQMQSRPQTPVQRKDNKEKPGVKVPLVFSPSSSPATTDREEEANSVIITDNRLLTPLRNMSSPTIPVHQRPLPPIPALPDVSTLRLTSSQPRSTLAQLAHSRLPTRLLHPKKPSTSPKTASAGSNSPMSRVESKPLTRLVPREEPRRLFASSRAQREEGRKGQMSALSFLALDDAASNNLSRSEKRTSSFSGSASNSCMDSAYIYHTGYSQAKNESFSQGSEGGYIMPPSERSKIGVDDRKAIRSRRRGSQSSLSSIAGSEMTSLPDDTKVVPRIGARIEKEVEDDWTTAYEFGRSKSRSDGKELRLSLGIGIRTTKTASPYPQTKFRPTPLDLFSLSGMAVGRDSEIGREYPKSAGLLPPPRPRRQINPAMTTTAPPVPPQPTSPITPNKRCGQISPRYFHHSTNPRSDVGSKPDVVAGIDSMKSEKGDRQTDGLTDFMIFNSPIIPSPNLTTPGQSFIFPSSKETSPTTSKNPQQERKILSTPEKSGSSSYSHDNSSNWSSDTYEKERKIITGLWLSSKPTKNFKSNDIEGYERNSLDQDVKQTLSDHPFYSIGRSSKMPLLNNGKGESVVIDGGYGERASTGIKS
ncbi:uncharacterized protein I206_101019 [Kwoniella pini CBS 10737]|uniref:Uncharacterized protein n=1 Tax=Kwoniella pini CBS 10737 TaxID=1296096 RepID=A0A1B9IBT6_9TREE|nr:uncharacterized protein I206_00307 [Kwoniella pini CBS 10737]OCF53006.1 hypothetical protein I206_00307 [Kwoniella pini CBS 10737]